MTARALMQLTGAPFAVVAPLLSLTAALAGTVIVFRLIETASDSFAAGTAVLALHVFPTSPTFQIAYSEGMALLLLAGSLWAIRKGRLRWLLGLTVLLSLTRPIVIALAVTVLVFAIFSATGHKHLRCRPTVIGTVVMMLATMAIWPLAAALVTGEPRAFSLTQGAWPANAGPLGLWGNWLIGTILQREGVLFGIAFVALLFCVVPALRASSSAWGPELRVWSVVYPLFILLSTRPSFSLFRYLLLTIAPFWPLPERWELGISRDQRLLRILMPALLVGGFLYLQWLWLTRIYVVGSDTQPHP